MRIPIITAGSPGLVTDPQDTIIPIEAFSAIENLRFVNRKGRRWKGPTDLGLSIAAAMAHLFCYRAANTRPGIIAASETAIYYTSGETPSDYTGASGPYAATNGWVFTNMNGLPVMTAEEEIPQVCLDTELGPFEDLPNWPAGWLAKSVKRFKNVLVAMNITKSGVEYPHLLATSSITDPGSIPASWDSSDPTTLATENPLSSEGELITGEELGDAFIVYKPNKCVLMQVGGQNLFRYDELFNRGIIGKWAVCTFLHDADNEVKHFVVDQNDIYIHNGSRATSLFADWLKDYFFSIVNPEVPEKIYCINNENTHEIYVFFPRDTATEPSHALVWNYRHNTASIVDLQMVWPVNFGSLVVFDNADQSWDADTETWEQDTTTWNNLVQGQVQNFLIGLDGLDFVSLDTGTPTAAVLIERQGLNILGKDQNGAPIFDTDRRKLFEAVYPRISGEGTIRITVGAKETENASITWGIPYNFVLGTEIRAPAYSCGRIGAVKFESVDSSEWEFIGYDLEVRDAGAGV